MLLTDSSEKNKRAILCPHCFLKMYSTFFLIKVHAFLNSMIYNENFFGHMMAFDLRGYSSYSLGYYIGNCPPNGHQMAVFSQRCMLKEKQQL